MSGLFYYLQNYKTMGESKISCHAKADGVALYYEDGRRTFLPFAPLDNAHQLYVKPFPLPGERPEYEKDKYTGQQNRHYRLAVYGLGAIPQNELKAMSPRQIKGARSTFMRAQAEINRMKNETLDNSFDKIFIGIFKEGGKVVKALKTRCTDQYNEVYNVLPLSFLGITKDMVIDRLTQAGILNPKVFNL